MDLLLLHSRCSQTDLRPSHGRQLPQIPTSPQGSGQGGGGEMGGDGGGGGGGGVEARDHTYTEVGIRNNPTPTHCLDDGLYESVGIRESDTVPKVTSVPPPTSTSTPATIRAQQSPPSVNGHGNVSPKFCFVLIWHFFGNPNWMYRCSFFCQRVAEGMAEGTAEGTAPWTDQWQEGVMVRVVSTGPLCPLSTHCPFRSPLQRSMLQYGSSER